jgi:hypothetical protein
VSDFAGVPLPLEWTLLVLLDRLSRVGGVASGRSTGKDWLGTGDDFARNNGGEGKVEFGRDVIASMMGDSHGIKLAQEKIKPDHL